MKYYYNIIYLFITIILKCNVKQLIFYSLFSNNLFFNLKNVLYFIVFVNVNFDIITEIKKYIY